MLLLMLGPKPWGKQEPRKGSQHQPLLWHTVLLSQRAREGGSGFVVREQLGAARELRAASPTLSTPLQGFRLPWGRPEARSAAGRGSYRRLRGEAESPWRPQPRGQQETRPRAGALARDAHAARAAAPGPPSREERGQGKHCWVKSGHTWLVWKLLSLPEQMRPV